GAPLHLIPLLGADDVFRRDTRRVIGHDMRQLAQPEFGQFRQDLALAGYGIVKNDVEGGDAVGGHDKQLVVADGIHVPDFAACQQRQRLNAGLMKGLSQNVSLKKHPAHLAPGGLESGAWPAPWRRPAVRPFGSSYCTTWASSPAA